MLQEKANFHRNFHWMFFNNLFVIDACYQRVTSNSVLNLQRLNNIFGMPYEIVHDIVRYVNDVPVLLTIYFFVSNETRKILE